ncbi:MAG: hypothetical protein RI841_12350 [Halomonas sp.]|nr:hypothetical protein [Halomonas sp.]MDR9440261.1 hypothetical protein [Halomonas sp.]
MDASPPFRGIESRSIAVDLQVEAVVPGTEQGGAPRDGLPPA